MAVSLIEKNYETNYCQFSYDNWDEDKYKLPNLTMPGKEGLSTIKSCIQGSIAMGVHGDMHILTGDNEWIEY